MSINSGTNWLAHIFINQSPAYKSNYQSNQSFYQQIPANTYETHNCTHNFTNNQPNLSWDLINDTCGIYLSTLAAAYKFTHEGLSQALISAS